MLAPGSGDRFSGWRGVGWRGTLYQKLLRCCGVPGSRLRSGGSPDTKIKANNVRPVRLSLTDTSRISHMRRRHTYAHRRTNLLLGISKCRPHSPSLAIHCSVAANGVEPVRPTPIPSKTACVARTPLRCEERSYAYDFPARVP